MRILIVEDNEPVARSLADALEKQHHTVDWVADGESGWQQIEAMTYDLILLDVMLPQVDGISLCRRIRASSITTPVLMLTAKDSSTDKVLGLDAGADDYVVKPFDLPELSARIRALLRRGNTTTPSLLSWEHLCLDPSKFVATYADTLLELTRKEYAILELLLRNGDRVLSRSVFIDHLWALDDIPEEEAVKFHIKELRKKLKLAGAPPNLIETVYGLGYRLRPI
ncbi:DNA-binding response regulator [Tumidithrix helvetica PCC 7403]|uniref:response regulator transcription factor n=1 Tax=Tumidithrix helvetica TaxID=3457545 RepID=UPI003C91F599